MSEKDLIWAEIGKLLYQKDNLEAQKQQIDSQIPPIVYQVREKLAQIQQIEKQEKEKLTTKDTIKEV